MTLTVAPRRVVEQYRLRCQQILHRARHQRHARALSQKGARAGKANAFAAAGDEDVFVGEFEIHNRDKTKQNKGDFDVARRISFYLKALFHGGLASDSS